MIGWAVVRNVSLMLFVALSVLLTINNGTLRLVRLVRLPKGDGVVVTPRAPNRSKWMMKWKRNKVHKILVFVKLGSVEKKCKKRRILLIRNQRSEWIEVITKWYFSLSKEKSPCSLTIRRFPVHEQFPYDVEEWVEDCTEHSGDRSEFRVEDTSGRYTVCYHEDDDNHHEV